MRPRHIDWIRCSRASNWEDVNALNWAQCDRADTAYAGVNFGCVTGMASGNAPRTIQMALRLNS